MSASKANGIDRMVSCLYRLPPDVVSEITSYLDVHDLGNLWFCGDSRIHRLLGEQRGWKDFELRATNFAWPSLACELLLSSLTIEQALDSPRHHYLYVPNVQLKRLPRTLTKLSLTFRNALWSLITLLDDSIPLSSLCPELISLELTGPQFVKQVDEQKLIKSLPSTLCELSLPSTFCLSLNTLPLLPTTLQSLTLALKPRLTLLQEDAKQPFAWPPHLTALHLFLWNSTVIWERLHLPSSLTALVADFATLLTTPELFQNFSNSLFQSEVPYGKDYELFADPEVSFLLDHAPRRMPAPTLKMLPPGLKSLVFETFSSFSEDYVAESVSWSALIDLPPEVTTVRLGMSMSVDPPLVLTSERLKVLSPSLTSITAKAFVDYAHVIAKFPPNLTVWDGLTFGQGEHNDEVSSDDEAIEDAVTHAQSNALPLFPPHLTKLFAACLTHQQVMNLPRELVSLKIHSIPRDVDVSAIAELKALRDFSAYSLSPGKLVSVLQALPPSVLSLRLTLASLPLHLDPVKKGLIWPPKLRSLSFSCDFFHSGLVPNSHAHDRIDMWFWSSLPSTLHTLLVSGTMEVPPSFDCLPRGLQMLYLITPRHDETTSNLHDYHLGTLPRSLRVLTLNNMPSFVSQVGLEKLPRSLTRLEVFGLRSERDWLDFKFETPDALSRFVSRLPPLLLVCSHNNHSWITLHNRAMAQRLNTSLGAQLVELE